MPFYDMKSDDPPPPIELRVEGRKTFRLMEGFRYRSRAGDDYEVPPHADGATTDLASVPSALWGVLASYGRQLRAALLHDHLCFLVDELISDGKPEKAERDRRIADDLFREAMRERDDDSSDPAANLVPWFRSWLFWAGVSFGRYLKFARLRAWIVIGLIVGAFAAIAGVIGLLPGPPVQIGGLRGPVELYGLLYAILLLSSVACLRDVRLAIIALTVGPIIIPLLAITVTTRLVLAVPDWILYFASRRKEPGSVVDPTVALGGGFASRRPARHGGKVDAELATQASYR
jgi:hypothetical protein